MGLLFLILPFDIASAGFGPHAVAPEAPNVREAKAKPVRRRSGRLRTIMERDKKLMELLARQEDTLIVRSTGNVVPALTRLNGILINSILATNLLPTTFIVRIGPGNRHLQNAELKCAGMAPDRRVLSRCDLLVADGKEYPVDVQIWDKDGGGMLPDKYWSGEEKSFLTSSFAAFLGGVWDAAKDRVTGSFGTVTEKSGRNALLKGLGGASQNAQELIAQDGRKRQSVSFVNSGRRVRIFFNKSLNLNLKEVIR